MSSTQLQSNSSNGNDSGATSAPPSGRVVVLNGFPGTGKLTLLTKVKQLLPIETTCLLNNHKLIDPVAAVLPDRSPEHHELRRKIQQPIFEGLRKRAQDGDVILMTACLAADNETDAACLQDHLAIVRGTNIPIYWINVHCEQSVLEQRLTTSERRHGEKTKLTDVHVLRELLRTHCLAEPLPDDNTLEVVVTRDFDATGPADDSVSRLMSMVGLSTRS